MKQLNDTELDALIGAAVERQVALNDLNHTVMTSLRRQARRRWLRRWGRMVAFAFGLPLVVVLWVMAFVSVLWPREGEPWLLVAAIPVVVVLLLGWLCVQKFTVERV